MALQQLALLAGFDLDAPRREDPEFVHTVTECAKLAFADREAFYGDPDFVEVPVATLLSDAYNAKRVASWWRARVARAAARRASRALAAPSRCMPRTSAEDVAHAGALGDAAPGAGEPTVARDRDGRRAGRVAATPATST